MTPLIRPYHVTNCHMCGNLVPEANLSEHILADARILQIIKATHPDWTHEECGDYLKSFAGAKDGMKAPAKKEVHSRLDEAVLLSGVQLR